MVVGEGNLSGGGYADYGGFGVRCGRGREGGLLVIERLWEFWGGGWSRTKLNVFQTLSCDLSFGLALGGMGVGGSLTVRSLTLEVAGRHFFNQTLYFSRRS